MSAIRIRPAGSTVSYHPCLFTHHFNVEKNIWDQPKMLHHARVVLALGGWRGWAVGWYVSPPALCCTSAPLSNPSISCGLNFPPFPLLLSFHFLLSLFPTSRLWLSLPRREPDSSSPHPSRSKWKLSAQLFSSPSTWLFDCAMVESLECLSSYRYRSVFHAASSSSIYSSKIIIFVMPVFFHPPFVIFMFVDVHLSSFYLSTNPF